MPTWEADPDAWWRAVEVNLRTHFLFTYAVLPDMLARHQGRIINMSSGVVYGPSPYTSAYSAAKTGLTNFTGVLAAEVKEHGVSVLAYAPGTVRTAMAEYALSSPEVHRPFQEAFRQTYARGLDTPWLWRWSDSCSWRREDWRPSRDVSSTSPTTRRTSCARQRKLPDPTTAILPWPHSPGPLPFHIQPGETPKPPGCQHPTGNGTAPPYYHQAHTRLTQGEIQAWLTCMPKGPMICGA